MIEANCRIVESELIDQKDALGRDLDWSPAAQQHLLSAHPCGHQKYLKSKFGVISSREDLLTLLNPKSPQKISLTFLRDGTCSIAHLLTLLATRNPSKISLEQLL